MTFFSVDSEPASSANIVISRIGFNPVIGGSNDRFEETAVLDRSEFLPRWRWITWELSDCFQSRWTAAGSDEPWSQVALRQVVARNLQTQSWKATYRSLRSDLFAQLLNDSPAYVEYFLRTVTDVLNHEATPEFMEEWYDHYETLLNDYRDPLDGKQVEDFRTAADYLKHRPDFIR